VTAVSPAAEAFAQAVAEMSEHPGVETTRMFGSAGLKTHGRTFAMIVKGRLVVKLPRDRVDALVSAGTGDRFDPGHGRLMREWISLAEAVDRSTSRALVAEAYTFVAAVR
jgi:TfoX/Sxy family transcriptional regulator of competence genes